jgi:hypothetical protein
MFRYGVPRVARGVTRSLFLAQQDDLPASLRSFVEPEIDPNDAAMFQPVAGAGIARPLTAANQPGLFSPMVTDGPNTGSSDRGS